MDCFGSQDCASNHRCAGGVCVEITAPPNPDGNNTGCLGEPFDDLQLPPSWDDTGFRLPPGVIQCGIKRVEQIDPITQEPFIELLQGQPCPPGTVCTGNFCLPDWNDPYWGFDWENYDPEDSSTWPYDPDEEETWPKPDEVLDCAGVPVPQTPPGGSPEGSDPNTQGPSDSGNPFEDFRPDPGLIPDFPELTPPPFPELPALTLPELPELPGLDEALSCSDEPNCGGGDFELPEWPDPYEGLDIPEFELPEFPEIPFDIADPDTWPDDEDFNPDDADTWPDDEDDYTDDPGDGVGDCAGQCDSGKYLVNGACRDIPCSIYCTELYQTDPEALRTDPKCGKNSYCTGACQECAKVPGKGHWSSGSTQDKGYCVSKVRSQFEDENGDGIPDEGWNPDGFGDDPVPFGGVHCKCLKEEEIPDCWVCDQDGIIRPDPANCQICVNVDDWRCSCGKTLSAERCRRGDQMPVSADSLRQFLADECAKLCPPNDPNECQPTVEYIRVDSGEGEPEDCNRPDVKCRFAGFVQNAETGETVDIWEAKNYSALSARCKCDVECVCHAECGPCQVCTDQGFCIPDPASPAECCDPRYKRLRQTFEVFTEYLPATSCEGIEILPYESKTEYAEFDVRGIDNFTLPPAEEIIDISQTCGANIACSNLERKDMGKIVYTAPVGFEGEEREGRNWYVGQYYSGECRGMFNRVTRTTIRLFGDPIITCEP